MVELSVIYLIIRHLCPRRFAFIPGIKSDTPSLFLEDGVFHAGLRRHGLGCSRRAAAILDEILTLPCSWSSPLITPQLSELQSHGPASSSGEGFSSAACGATCNGGHGCRARKVSPVPSTPASRGYMFLLIQPVQHAARSIRVPLRAWHSAM